MSGESYPPLLPGMLALSWLTECCSQDLDRFKAELVNGDYDAVIDADTKAAFLNGGDVMPKLQHFFVAGWEAGQRFERVALADKPAK